MIVAQVSQAILPVPAHHGLTAGAYSVDYLWPAPSPDFQISQAEDARDLPARDVGEDGFQRSQVAVDVGNERYPFRAYDFVMPTHMVTGAAG